MNAHDIIADQVVASLPPDIDGRLRVLGALVEVLPRESDRRSYVIRSLTALNTHVQMQTEFADLSAARRSSRLSDRPIARTRVAGTPSVPAAQLKPGHEYVMHWAGYSQRVWVYNGDGGALYFRTQRSEHPVATVPDADWYPVAPKGGAR